jgi:hypothetical protein
MARAVDKVGDELVVMAVDAGLSIGTYLVCRTVEVGQDDVMGAWCGLGDEVALLAYAKGRVGGLGHDDLTVIGQGVFGVDQYWQKVEILLDGVSTAELAELVEVDFELAWYRRLLDSGLPHEDIMDELAEAVKRGVLVVPLALARDAGATADEVWEFAMNYGDQINEYWAAREQGESHQQIM